jgi:DNA ligase-1
MAKTPPLPGIIPTGEVSLAHVFHPERDDVNGWIVEPKLDGVRCVMFRGLAVTRAGKPIPSVSDIARHFASLPFALDGELMLPGRKFEGTVGEVRQTKRISETLVYNVFDAIPASGEQTPFIERRGVVLEATSGAWSHERVARTPFDLVDDPHAACAHALADGFEGIMLKDPAAPYRPGRTRSTLKMKPWLDTNATVLEVIAGEGKHEGRLGALVVQTEAGVRCKVGTGFSDGERAALWANRDTVAGSVVELVYQELTERGALRFPTFRRIRGDL